MFGCLPLGFGSGGEFAGELCGLGDRQRLDVCEVASGLSVAKGPTAAREPEPEDEPLGPALYDTGLDDSEGLWLRSGWAGRG